MQDPYPFYARARAAGALFWWEDYGMPCAAGHATVAALLRDRRLGREPIEGKPVWPAHLANFYAVDDLSLLDREPPDHTRLRGLVLRAFTSRRIGGMSPEIEALAHALIDRIETPEFDLLPAFAERLPVVVIARLLGVPEAMSDQLLAWSHAMVAMYQARRDRALEDRADAAARDFAAYLQELVAERRTRPADDLISHLIAAEADGGRLTTDEMVATCILLLNAGHEATVSVIGNGLRALLTATENPARYVTGSAAVASVEEMLRFDPPLHLFTRIAVEDVDLFGHRFAAGDTVGCLLAAAGRDAARFGDPDTFDPSRTNASEHLAFGAGRHFCLGAPLARLELAVAFRVLFERMPPLRIARPPRFADRYHFRGLEALWLRSD